MRTTKHDTDPQLIPLIRAIEMIAKLGHVHPATVRRRIEIGAYPLTMIKTNMRIVHVNAAHAKIIAQQEREKLIAALKGQVDVEAIVEDSAKTITTQRDEWKKCATSLANARTPFEKINARAMFDRLCSPSLPHIAPAPSAAGPTPQPSVDRDEQQTGRPRFQVGPWQPPGGSISARGFTSAQKTAESGASSSQTGQRNGTKESSTCSSGTTRRRNGSAG